jgi:hypothetical protein
MSAQLRFLDTDGTTVITSLNVGNIASPGSLADKQLWVENFGDATAQGVTAALVAVGTNDGEDYAYLAPDSGGSPGSFVQTTLSLGDIASLAKIALWTKVTLPSNLTADNNPRRYNIRASGATI